MLQSMTAGIGLVTVPIQPSKGYFPLLPPAAVPVVVPDPDDPPAAAAAAFSSSFFWAIYQTDVL